MYWLVFVPSRRNEHTSNLLALRCILEVLMVASGKHMGKNDGIPMNKLSIEDVANWFLAKESMTHKKLQKLCYYAVAWGYTLTGDNIVVDDQFQAWVHGPVSPTLYKIYEGSGWNLLPSFIGQINFPPNVEEIMESVWLTYGDKGGNELEALSHSEQPWIQARAGSVDSARTTNPIDVQVMKDFYNSIKSTDF